MYNPTPYTSRTHLEQHSVGMRFDFPRVQRTLGGEDLSRWDASRLKQKGAHTGEVMEIIDRMGMASAKVRFLRYRVPARGNLASMPQTHNRVTPHTHGCLDCLARVTLSSYGHQSTTSPTPFYSSHRSILHTLSTALH